MPTEPLPVDEITLTQERKNKLITELNKRGFFLEDKAWKILSSDLGANYYEDRNLVKIDLQGQQVEIDAYIVRKGYVVIAECKRNEFSWIFLNDKTRYNEFNLLSDSKAGIQCISYKQSFSPQVYSGFLVEEKKSSLECTSKTSQKQERIYDNIRQILNNQEAIIAQMRHLGKIIIPIIITNSSLYLMEYEKSNIDNSGDLTDYGKLSKVPAVCFNFPRILRWDSGLQEVKDKSFSRSQIKSILIVDINHLRNLLLLMDAFFP